LEKLSLEISLLEVTLTEPSDERISPLLTPSEELKAGLVYELLKSAEQRQSKIISPSGEAEHH
jgi:hypothetical protein